MIALHHGDPEDGHPKHLGRPEFKSNFSHRRCKQNHDDHTEKPTDQGADKAHIQGFLGFALSGHGMTVQQGGNIGRRSGDIDQNSGYGPAGYGRRVHGTEKN
jgi:hypothetical protein